MADASGDLFGAYPFIDRPTEHQVRFLTIGITVYAMCAIDALGAGAMLQKDTGITSNCSWCGSVIRIQTTNQGTQLASVSPVSTTVQVKQTPGTKTAAESLCRDIRFYCSPLHAQYARRDELPINRHLTVVQALEVGRALFEQRALFNCKT